MTIILIIMGVAGSGKSTIGQLLADRLGCAFYDGDDFHPAANVEKMRHGQPLTDADRASWLSALADLIRTCLQRHETAVIACSALKQSYRDELHVADEVRFIYLRGTYDLFEARLRQRTGHYMPPSLLASQFAALEEPRDALTVDGGAPPEHIVAEIVRQL